MERRARSGRQRLHHRGRRPPGGAFQLARIGTTEWKTSLFPKDGTYIVPVKAVVRRAEGLEIGDLVTIRLAIGT